MENLQNEIPNSQPVPTNVRQETNIDEDEINLIEYFIVLWKHKYFILLVSVLPALIVGLMLFFRPRNYKVTYVYDVKDRSAYDVRDRSAYDVRDRSISDVSNWNLNEKNYTMLLNRFYSAENASKIITKLQKNGISRYANRINTAGLKNFVEFEVSPSYPDLSKVKMTDAGKLEQIRQLKASLLNMTIAARPKKDIPIIASVVRDNLENVMPVYLAEEQVKTATREFRTKMADIEENRFNLKLDLKTNK